MSFPANLRRRLTRPLLLWPVTALVLELVIQDRGGAPRWLTLLPLVPMLLFIVALARTIRKMDELQQRISLGTRSVPVVDVGGRRLVGNATSEQLAELIAPPEPVGVAS